MGGAAVDAGGLRSIAHTLDKVAHEVGVNFIGGYSAMVSKGMTEADERLDPLDSQGACRDGEVCSSVKWASTRTGINIGCGKADGEVILQTARGHPGCGFAGMCEAGRVLQCA